MGQHHSSFIIFLVNVIILPSSAHWGDWRVEVNS